MKTGRNSLKIKFGIKMGAVLIFVLVGVTGVLIKNNAFANNSDGAGGVGGGSGNPSNKPCDEHTPGDCSDCGFENEQQARRCPHYIITSIEDFRDRAWVRQIAGPYTQEAFDICTDPVRNPSGKVVWVGMEGIYDGVPDYVLKNLVTGLVKYKKISTFSNVLTDPKETPNDKKHEIYKLKPNYGTAEIRRSKELRNRYGTEPLENDANYFWDKVVPGYQFAPGTETLPENQRVPMTWFVAMQIVMDQLNLGDDTTLAFFCPGLIGPPPPPPGDTPPPPPNPDFDIPKSGVNFGKTAGAVAVQNASEASPSKDWKRTNFDALNQEVFTYARPGDSLRFSHALHFGAQGVEGSDNFGETRHRNSPIANHFSITASPSNSFLFGNHDNIINGSTVELDRTNPRPPQVAQAEKVKDYFFEVYSPSSFTDATKSTANNRYSCLAPSFLNLNPYQTASFQVPGFGTNPLGCNAATEIGQTSLVGQKFSQTLTFNNVKGWVNQRSKMVKKTCGCGHESKAERIYINSLEAAEKSNSTFPWGEVQVKCEYVGTCRRGQLDNYRSYPGHGERRYPTTFVDEGEVKKTASVYVPYNFTTQVSSSIDTDEVVFGGSPVDSTFSYKILPRANPAVSKNPYATITPPESKYKIIEFLLPNHSSSISGKHNVTITHDNLCSTFHGATACKEIETGSGPFNEEGRYYGVSDYISPETRTVPDRAVGMKYCVAIGIYPADSHNYGPSDDVTNQGLAMRGGSTWNISSASCRTIAKKPNFQVWGGGVFTRGGINTAVTEKIVDAGLGGYYTSPHTPKLFGSWDEFAVIAGGKVQGFASGAKLGYGAGYNFPLPGGHPDTSSLLKLSPLTIANNTANQAGKSGINVGNALVEKLKARYRNLNIVNPTNQITNLTRLDNGMEYVKVSGNTTLSGITIKGLGDPSANNTRVYYIDGTLTIDGNICYSDNIYECAKQGVHLINYSLATNNIAALPQILIFARNIHITNQVSRIDAWLIAEEGEINTCPSFQYNSRQHTADHCDRTLMINGPVFAKHLELRRTAGAYPGAGIASGSVLTRELTHNGSITPAEIFNLRSDAYYWAYHQAQRSTEAIVTYTRELAPRW